MPKEKYEKFKQIENIALIDKDPLK